MRIQKGPYCLQSVTGSPLGHRPPTDGPSRSALMRSWVLEAKLITLTQPENFRFQLAACGKAKKFSDRKITVRLARHCRRQAEHRNDLRLL